jgi:AcrR family transcriptional regulator
MTSSIPELPEKTSPKRRAILAGARQVFMEVGFERACVDVIAARAGVSKATVYSHFADKSALFVASFLEKTQELRAGFVACIGEPAGPIEEDLQRIGEKLMGLLLSPEVVALYRHTSAECARFPEIGQMLYDRGAGVVSAALVAHLRAWEDRGELSIEEHHAAAMQFSMLCQGDLYFRAQIGILKYPADDRVRESVASAVRVFLRAYGTRPPAKRSGAAPSRTKRRRPSR